VELYFLRHGIAVEPNEWGMRPDSERPLTEEGVAKFKKAALGMAKMKLEFDRVLSSPYVRALETARLALKGLDSDCKIETTPALEPDADYADFLKLLPKTPSKEKWLFVGHQPSIGEFTARLFTGKVVSIDFKKGALARVDADPSAGGYAGTLAWLLTQRQLRALA